MKYKHNEFGQTHVSWSDEYSCNMEKYLLSNQPPIKISCRPLHSLLNYKTLPHHSKFTYLQIPFFHSFLANTSRETWLWEEAVHWFYQSAFLFLTLSWLMLLPTLLEVLEVGPLTLLDGLMENALGLVTPLVCIYNLPIVKECY